jgi:hypothetical protein
VVTRIARLKDFRTDGYPGGELPVQILAEDHVGTYILSFPCEHMNGGVAERDDGRGSLGQHRCMA